MKNQFLPTQASAPLSRQQHGIVLIITLIGLVVLLLAGLSLARSVDTATMIAGNLAFKRASIAAGDTALFDAQGPMRRLRDLSAIGGARGMWTNPADPLNQDAAPGYYSTIDFDRNGIEDIGGLEGLNLMGSNWDMVGTPESVADASGNTYSYIIQRMYRGSPGVVPTALDALTNDTPPVGTDKSIRPPPLSSLSGNSMVYRITMRIRGPRNSTSYIQAFVY